MKRFLNKFIVTCGIATAICLAFLTPAPSNNAQAQIVLGVGGRHGGVYTGFGQGYYGGYGRGYGGGWRGRGYNGNYGPYGYGSGSTYVYPGYGAYGQTTYYRTYPNNSNYYGNSYNAYGYGW